MNAKSKFPLSLASVQQGNSQKKSFQTAPHSSSSSTATPQTATRNAALQNQARADQKSLTQLPAQAKAQSVNPIAPSAAMASEKIRKAMVARVAQKGVKDELVLAALEAVPRHLFIESGLASQAYIDASLPIGYHQTISQPYIVARMIEVMRDGSTLNRVMEIGTGCGYQAAVLSLVAKEVFSIERIKSLHELAKTNLRPMRIANIRLHYGDGMLGLPQAAPFDGIILAAAGLEIPQALLEQLQIGGRLIGPVGTRNQMLQLVQRVGQREWQSSILEPCHFVPLHQGVM
jgi:protein-L-isoaspartate(D-aspartate) O-methyltransferase